MVFTMDKSHQNSQSYPKALSLPVLTSVSYQPGTFSLMGSSSAFRPPTTVGAPSNGCNNQQPDSRPLAWSSGSHTWWSPAEAVSTTSGLFCATSSLQSSYSSSPCGSFRPDSAGTIVLDTTSASDHVPQPRRISGVNGSTSSYHSFSTRVNSSSPNELETSGNKSEKCKENGDISSSSTNLSDNPLLEVSIHLPEERKKSVSEKQNKTDFRVVSTLSTSSRRKDDNPRSPELPETWKASRNGIQKIVITKTQGKYRKKQPEGALPHETSSDNESQSEDYNESSNGAENSSSSESASSESSEVMGNHTQHQSKGDDGKHQRSKLRPRKHTKEAEPPPKKPPDEDNIPEPLNLKARTDSPSPAHVGTTSTTLCFESSPRQDSDFMSAPLDLCMKKQEREEDNTVAEQSLSPSETPTSLSSAAYSLLSSTFSSQPTPTGFLLIPGSRRRGRKPKYLVAQEKQTEITDKRNSEMKHQQKQLRLAKKLQALQEKEAVEATTKVVPNLTIASLPSELTICPVTSPTQVKKVKTSDSTASSTFTIVTTNNKMSFQTLGYSSQLLQSPDKSNCSVTLDMEKLMAYMLPHASPSRGRGRGRPRGSGRGRGRGRPPIDNCSSKREKTPQSQTKISLPNERLSTSEPTNETKSSSASEASDSDENIEEDDDDQSATASTASSGVASPSRRGIKRHSQEGEGFSPKKKRILPDEKETRIPLEHGWRRQTKIRCFSRSGVRGEVVYYAPCGKKLKNYPEVCAYTLHIYISRKLIKILDDLKGLFSPRIPLLFMLMC
ncbi:uncharacterized protein LOC143237021 isoform X3 [Tachypleus tridentatus]|uniref:uncharacterized protein LOC143237021 isoform X3 n=1 Tax=Tachypleus tridentatus TaxID=6853 RepID=UPI003FD618CF